MNFNKRIGRVLNISAFESVFTEDVEDIENNILEILLSSSIVFNKIFESGFVDAEDLRNEFEVSVRDYFFVNEDNTKKTYLMSKNSYLEFIDGNYDKRNIYYLRKKEILDVSD